jgi:hypothetical protein
MTTIAVAYNDPHAACAIYHEPSVAHLVPKHVCMPYYNAGTNRDIPNTISRTHAIHQNNINVRPKELKPVDTPELAQGSTSSDQQGTKLHCPTYKVTYRKPANGCCLKPPSSDVRAYPSSCNPPGHLSGCPKLPFGDQGRNSTLHEAHGLLIV